MQISIDSGNLEDIRALWKQAPDITRREMEAITTEAQFLLEREIKELTPDGATGVLKKSIRADEPVSLGNSVIGVVGTNAAHALPVELGTKPHFPPLEPLKDWVRFKLDISTEEEVESVALAIARKIAARGTIAVGMFHRAFATNRIQVGGMYSAGVVRIRNGLAAV